MEDYEALERRVAALEAVTLKPSISGKKLNFGWGTFHHH
jgi:hypothetical protein